MTNLSNMVSLKGRMTRDWAISYTKGETQMAIGSNSIAVPRKMTKEQREKAEAAGLQTADFPSVKAFGKTAENLEKYAPKGTKLHLGCHVQTGSYIDKDGRKVYTTEFIIDDWEFEESKRASGNTDAEPKADATPADADGFMEPAGEGLEGIPFDA